MRKRKLSKKAWAVDYRTKYQEDSTFRESERERKRSSYVPKPKSDTYVIDGRTMVTSKKFCELIGVSYWQLQRMLYDKIIPVTPRLAHNNRYLFWVNNAQLIVDYLPVCLNRPTLKTIERYDLSKLKLFLARNWDKYFPENRTEETLQ